MRRSVLVATAVATAVAIVGSIVYLLGPPMGTDLSAQVAHADFFAAYGFRPVDFRWYGGTSPFGYSLISPPLMAAIGARGLGVVSAVISSAALAYVFARTGARRPAIAGALGAICLVGDMVSGRTTFAFGVAFGIGALAVLVTPEIAVLPRRILVAVLALLATLASPVAGLFLGLVAGAILLGEVTWKDRRPQPGGHWPDAVIMGAATIAGLVPGLIFGDAGYQPFAIDSVRTNIAIALTVAILVPASYRMVRAGALLAIVMLLVALYVHSALGSNALRLTMLFAIPTVVAYATLSRWWLAGLVIALVWWQNPVMTNDIEQAGSPETKAAFYQPLLAELGTRGAIGRMEVVPLRDHWESRYVANQVPLARGWERQVDTLRNPLFYHPDALTIASYGSWLRDNAVGYVAIAANQPLDPYATGEAAIVADHPSYLHRIWTDADWTLYAVTGVTPYLSSGTLVTAAPDKVVFDESGSGDVTVRVAWSRWLTVLGPAGACVAPAAGGWTSVRAPAPGRYTITSAVTGARKC